MSTPIDTRKLYRQVADAIMASIQSGDYEPGSRLPSERDLAASFKVSRPTIREAMIALEIHGLVEARQGSGIYVTDHPPAQIGADDLDIGAFELTEARRLFEAEAAALAATIITEEQLREIEEILGDMIKENVRKQKGEMADRRFHVAIARATRNSAITAVIENLWDIRHKSPLCAHMLERAGASSRHYASTTAKPHAMPCGIIWPASLTGCSPRPRPMRWIVRARKPSANAMNTRGGWRFELTADSYWSGH